MSPEKRHAFFRWFVTPFFNYAEIVIEVVQINIIVNDKFERDARYASVVNAHP
jgi:hypothetical protein